MKDDAVPESDVLAEVLNPPTLADAVDAALDKSSAVEPMNIDVTSFTLGELSDIEDLIGEEALSSLLTTVSSGGTFRPSMKTLMAVVWIMKRRADSSLTIDDVRAMPIASVELA